MSNLRPHIPVASLDAALIKTVLGARPLPPAKFSPFTGWTEIVQAPTPRENDDAKHLRLIAKALRGEAS